MRLVLVAVAAVLAVGCGSSGPCSEPSGTYRIRMQARTGNCGQTIETVAVISGQVETGCVGTASVSEDRCEYEHDMACPDGMGGAVRMTGKIELARDAASATAAMSVQAYDSYGYAVCQGSYDVTYTKL